GGPAAARRADDGDHFARADVETDLVEGLGTVGEDLRDVLEGQGHGLGRAVHGRGRSNGGTSEHEAKRTERRWGVALYTLHKRTLLIRIVLRARRFQLLTPRPSPR